MAEKSVPTFFQMKNGELLNVSEIRRVTPLKYIGRFRYSDVYLKGDKKDEPTTELTENEYKELMSFIRYLDSQGKAEFKVTEEPANA